MQEFISSDTNVWIDFSITGHIDFPFRLPYTYIMNSDAINDELLQPPGLRGELLANGLVAVELDIEEFNLADDYGTKYIKLSTYDRIALAIAKHRGITLLTGDGALRKAAKAEGVRVLGTIGILDRLVGFELIEEFEYVDCLKSLQMHNGRDVRLPKADIEERLNRYVENK